jgi:hypothetical protein
MSARTWQDIGSDVNWTEYGGRWARHVGGTRYHVLRFENCAEWGDGATGYHCDLSEVDVASPQLESALDSCGLSMADMADIQDKGREWAKVDALAGYGAAAPLWQDSGTNAHKLIRAGKRESRALSADPQALEARLDRPVNKIGSTAREYAAGDINSAILRGLSEGDPRAELMAKLGMLRG